MKSFLLSGITLIGGLFFTSEVSAGHSSLNHHYSYNDNFHYSCQNCITYPTKTYYYYPVNIVRKSDQNSCQFCGAGNTSRTLFRDNLTPYQQRTTYYQKPHIFRNENPQPFSCGYQTGK